MLILLSLRRFHIQLVISYIFQNHFWQPQRICNCVHPAVGTKCVMERGITVTVVLSINHHRRGNVSAPGYRFLFGTCLLADVPERRLSQKWSRISSVFMFSIQNHIYICDLLIGFVEESYWDILETMLCKVALHINVCCCHRLNSFLSNNRSSLISSGMSMSCWFGVARVLVGVIVREASAKPSKQCQLS